MIIKEPYIQIKSIERKNKSGIILSEEKELSKNDVVVVKTYKGCESCKKDDKIILSDTTSFGYEIKPDDTVQFIDENNIIAVY